MVRHAGEVTAESPFPVRGKPKLYSFSIWCPQLSKDMEAQGAPRHTHRFLHGTSVVRGHSGLSECLSISGNGVHVILDVRVASAPSSDG